MKTQTRSRTKVMFIGCLALAIVGGFALQSAGQADSQDVAVFPAIHLSANGVAFTDDQGVSQAVPPQGVWESVTRQIRLSSSPDAQFHVGESLLWGKALTSYTFGDTCLVFERELGEPAPLLEILTSPEGTELVVQSQNDRCGGCATFWDRAADLEAWNCGVTCIGCVCTHCFSGPCPKPDPDWHEIICRTDPSFPGCDEYRHIQAN